MSRYSGLGQFCDSPGAKRVGRLGLDHTEGLWRPSLECVEYLAEKRLKPHHLVTAKELMVSILEFVGVAGWAIVILDFFVPRLGGSEVGDGLRGDLEGQSCAQRVAVKQVVN